MKAIALLALLALVAMTGVRATEVESTEVADIDFDDLEAENDSFLEVDASNEDEEEETDETEDESEEEDEAEEEAEEEAESEEEADSLAETDAETDAEFETAFAAAIGENARGKWHVYSNTITETAHEGITALALSRLAGDKQKAFNAEKLRVGVIWDDMPVGVDGQVAKAVKDGHMDVDTWTRLFFTTGGINDLVFNVHYGCLQHWHSMAPIQRAEAKNGAATRIVFTNDQVRSYIIAQIKRWWSAAAFNRADSATSSWYIGHILHTVQDSYPRGHTVRLPSTASGCGAIVSFQGYDAQHGNKAHKTGDYSPSNSAKEKDSGLQARYNCAATASQEILDAFAGCVKTGGCGDTLLDATLNRVYTLASGAGSSLAGGSAEEFAKAGIATDANYARVTVSGVTLFNPKSSKIAANHGVTLCQGAGPIQSKTPSGLGYYNSGPFTDFYNPTV